MPGGLFKETYDICGNKYHIFFEGTVNAVALEIKAKLWTDYKGERTIAYYTLKQQQTVKNRG